MKLKNLKANYTLVPNQWLRSKISFKAIGLIAVLQSLPDDWDFSIAGLMSLTGEGKTTIQSALKELEDTGFLVRTQTMENGRFGHNVIQLAIGRNTVGGKSADGKYAGVKSTTTKYRITKERITKERECALSEEAYNLSELLHQKIIENKPNRNISPSWREAWAMDIDKIHRLDHREWSQIQQVIEWCQQDDFWWKNILSGATLRQKFDRLEDDMKQEKDKAPQVLYLS